MSLCLLWRMSGPGSSSGMRVAPSYYPGRARCYLVNLLKSHIQRAQSKYLLSRHWYSSVVGSVLISKLKFLSHRHSSSRICSRWGPGHCCGILVTSPGSNIWKEQKLKLRYHFYCGNRVLSYKVAGKYLFLLIKESCSPEKFVVPLIQFRFFTGKIRCLFSFGCCFAEENLIKNFANKNAF